jgi:hypothetical protein
MVVFFKNRGISPNAYTLAFALILSAGLIFIAYSFPMMKLRFDIWQHVDHIRSYVLDPNANVTGRATWLKLWASMFRFFNTNDIFTYATVIHRVQFLLSCTAIYFAAKQLFTALLVFDESESEIEKKQWLSSLALSSVAVWLTIIGTFSFFQQAWIMWYSVNYQITLPMLFLALGLSVNALAVAQNTKLVVSKVLGAFVLVLGIYLFHAGELAYLVFYIFIGILCFSSKFKFNWKYVLLGAVFLSMVLYVLIRMYSDHVPALITLLKNGEYSKILTDIQTKGKWNVIDGGNRFSANWNELYRLSVFAFIPVVAFAWFKPPQMDQRVLCFVGLSLVFCFIPTFQYSAGLASLISYDGIVNRYYYASLIFLVLPLFAYCLVINFKAIKHPLGLLGLVLFAMLSVLIYSKKINNEGVYFKNIQSIRNSIKTKKIDIGVSDAFIASTGLQVGVAESKYINTRFVYCGSFESLYITRYIYGKKNMLFDRLGDFSVTECENHAKNHGYKIAYLN